MTKFLISFCLMSWGFLPLYSFGQKRISNSGTITFTLLAENEEIVSANKKVVSSLDTTTGEITFNLLVNDFAFENALMQEHFQENYLESAKFPDASFTGTITDFSNITIKTDGSYPVTVNGELTMHGTAQKVVAQGTMVVKGKTISAASSFEIVPANFGIKIPESLNPSGKVAISVSIKWNNSTSSETQPTSVLDQNAERVTASFKNSKVINAQSLETTHKGVMDFRISHRFGALNGGLYEMFGLDQASLRLSFDYGLTKRLMIGFGRSTYEKTYDGYLKYKILWQTAGSEKMPLSLIYYTNMSVNTLRFPDNLTYERSFVTRLNYVHQLILGRKFSDKITVQLMPTIVHRNFVLTAAEKNTVGVIGGAARWKFVNRIALNAEYFYVLPNQLAKAYTNSLSLGFDIETGGHVFQLHFTNSPIMIDKGFIAETTGKWLDGDINFGFNISRVFTICKPRKKELKPTE